MTKPKVLFLGLDSAGKTSLLYRLVHHVCPLTVPTLGTIREALCASTTSTCDSPAATLVEIGGLTCKTHVWTPFLAATQALLFVIDASDPSRFPSALSHLRDVLHKLNASHTHHKQPHVTPVLICFNKTDLLPTPQIPLHMSQAVDALLSETASLRPHVTLLPVSAKDSSGIDALLSWLHRAHNPQQLQHLQQQHHLPHPQHDSPPCSLWHSVLAHARPSRRRSSLHPTL